MFGLACVLLPTEYTSLQAELDLALGPFERGDADDLPASMLSFHDETDELQQLFRARLRYQRGSVRWLTQGHAEGFHLDFGALSHHLKACGLDQYEGTLEELEPDFDAFAGRFTKLKSRDPKTQRYGRWLNPLGQWDWWDLGGRFNGVITGEPRPGGDQQFISSGASAGRSIIGNLTHALGGAPSTHNAEIELNVELVETLRHGIDGEPFVPTAMVLPVGSGPDIGRWFTAADWHPIATETRTMLSAPADADYEALVALAYVRFADRIAAGVSYHF